MSLAASGAESASVTQRATPMSIAGAEHRGQPVGVVGLVLVVGGVVLQLIALLSAPWLAVSTHPGGSAVRLGFSDFTGQTQRGFAHVYFAWGAWVLLVLTLVCGVAACIRWRVSRAARVVGGLLGVLAAFATIAGVLVFAYQSDVGIYHVARNYSIGVYIAMLGCLATGFGAAAGEVGT